MLLWRWVRRCDFRPSPTCFHSKLTYLGFALAEFRSDLAQTEALAVLDRMLGKCHSHPRLGGLQRMYDAYAGM